MEKHTRNTLRSVGTAHPGGKRSAVSTNHSPQKPKTPPTHLARFTGLRREQRQQWKQGPEHYINELLRQTLKDVKEVHALPCTTPVTTADKIKAATKGGAVGFSVSFMMAKAWTSLWGWLAVLAKEDNPRLFFLVGAGGYVLIASLLHATVAKVAGFAPGGNYGGPAGLDKISFENYITLLGMWFVAKADGETEQADRVAKAIQAIVDEVIARAKQHEDDGRPLCFDFRKHPMLGAWLRNGHFHLAFFWYSVVYLISGGLAPMLREACMKMPGSVLERAGLYTLFEFLAATACGHVAGILTLGTHFLGNKFIQRGPDKPGLHQSYPQELEAVRQRLELLSMGSAELSHIRRSLIDGVAKAQMGKKERVRCEQVLRERLLPAIDRAIDELEKRGKQSKWLQRKEDLRTPEGRDAIARRRAGALAFKGAGKTAHKLVNQSPHAQTLRSAGEVLGNIPSLIPMAYALMSMYTLFATFMPFAEHPPGPMASNGTAPWPGAAPGAVNHTGGDAGVPAEVQEWSLVIGWILIAGFSGVRPFSIPGAELLLNLILAAALKLGHWTGLRQRASPAVPGVDQLPPPPPKEKRQKPRVDDDSAETLPDESEPEENASRSTRAPIQRPDVVMNLEFSEEEERQVVGRSISMPELPEIDEFLLSGDGASDNGETNFLAQADSDHQASAEPAREDAGPDDASQDSVAVDLQDILDQIGQRET